MSCIFSNCWVGPCRKETVGDSEFCQEHEKDVCGSCGKKATQSCGETMGPLVCGVPLCDQCEHELDEQGTNGSHFKHCKKGDQIYIMWLLRKPNATGDDILTEYGKSLRKKEQSEQQQA